MEGEGNNPKKVIKFWQLYKIYINKYKEEQIKIKNYLYFTVLYCIILV